LHDNCGRRFCLFGGVNRKWPCQYETQETKVADGFHGILSAIDAKNGLPKF
jgi:hypothetical protein